MRAPPFELLQILIACAESRNLNEAAKKIGISQPAVSVKLKLLEERVPIPVFGLEGKRKVLTHYGRALYAMARSQNERMGLEFERLNRTYVTAEGLVLKVGCRREVFERIAPLFIFPGKVEYTYLSSQEAIALLMNHSIDIAISYERPDSLEIVSKRLFESRCKLVVHRRWLKKRKLTLTVASDPDFLSNTPSLIYQRDGHLFKDWIHHLKMDYQSLKTAMVCQDWRTIQALVDTGHGYGLVPDYIPSYCKDVESVEIPESVIRKFAFYALFHKELRQIEAFRQILKFKGFE